MTVYTIVNNQRKQLELIEPAFNDGGEGYIYAINGHNNGVVKIYKDKTEAKKREQKILTMTTIANNPLFSNSRIMRDVAWPSAPIYDNFNNFIGYGMNKIRAEFNLSDIYVYPSNKNNNKISIKQRIQALINLCELIDCLHSFGHVFGDFNPDNIKVTSDMQVKFMDADSFAIQYQNKKFKCIVCEPGYVAPEITRAIKNKKYEDLPFEQSFTKYTDYYSLAIHIFYMLLRCNPFVMRNTNPNISMPALGGIDKLAEKGMSPFFKKMDGIDIPAQAPLISTFPDYLVKLFKRAFVESVTEITKRPTAQEWKRVLTKYLNDLKQCHSEHTHFYYSSNKQCPYCQADKIFNDISKQQTALIRTPSTITNTRTVTQVRSISTNKKTGTVPFWIITLLLTICSQIAASYYLYYPLALNNLDSKSLIWAVVIGAPIVAVIGSIVYNAVWSNWSTTGYVAGYDYFLSFLTSIGFIVAAIIAILILIVAFYILIAILIIAILIAIISGG